MRWSIPKKRAAAAAALAGTVALSFGLAKLNRADAHTRITTDVNWSEYIRPIFIQKCMPCHHPGGLAPDLANLTIYGTDTMPGAWAWAAQIEDEIMLGRMPPWNADDRFGSFSNARSLTKEEKDLIISWIRGGRPQGPLRNLPPPEEFARPGWTFGQPDVIVGLPQGHVVPPDQRFDAAEATLAVQIEGDTYITGYEFLVGDPQNVSRVTAWLHDPEGFEPQPIEMEVTGNYDPYAPETEREKTHMRPMPRGPHFLGQWVKGDGPVLFPETAGRKLYAGSSIQLRVEYARPDWADWTKEIRDNTRLGLFLGAPNEEFDLLVESKLIESAPFIIGAGSKAKQQIEYTFEENVHLLGIEPHAGPVATQVKIELFYPDGLVRTLAWVPRYQQRWATSYRFEAPVAAPKGARIVVTGIFDNTKDNVDNPNSPPVDVKTGPGYLDERLYAYLHYQLDDHLKLQPVIVTKEAPQSGGMLGGLGPDILSAAGAGRSVQEATAQVAESIEASTEPERVRIASNGYHQVQGMMHRPGAFSLYVYDDRMVPIDPRNFSGELLMDGGSRSVPLERFAPGDDFLSAWLEPKFPVTFVAKVNLGGADETFDFAFDAPAPADAGGTEQGTKAAFIQSPHGGWLESIEGTGYQVEAALPESGDLRFYFYGPGMKPVDPRNFRGDVEVIPEASQTSIKSVARLTPPSPRAEYLAAKVSPRFPLKVRASLAVGNGRREIEFEFDETTEEPWDAAADAATPPPVILGPHGSPELYPSANGFHFIEAALPRPGELRLYFYDTWKNPVDPGLFTADIESKGVTQPLARPAPGDDYLAAFLAPETPLKVTASVWIAGKEEKYTFRFDGVTSDPAIARNTAGAHMDHSTLHGGQLFMVDNLYHHIEGAMPRPGEFRVYFSDDYRRPLEPRNFSGTARIEHLNETTGEVTEEVFELQLFRPGDDFLTAIVPASMPSTLYALIKLGGVEKRFDFQFDAVTIDTGGSKAPMPGMAAATGAPGAGMQHTHVRPPFTIPQALDGILAAIDAKQEDLRQRIAAKDWYTLYQPGLDIADLVDALTKLGAGADPRQKGRLKIMLGAVNRTVNKLDRAGDSADAPRIQAAFEELAGIVREIHAMFPVKK